MIRINHKDIQKHFKVWFLSSSYLSLFIFLMQSEMQADWLFFSATFSGTLNLHKLIFFHTVIYHFLKSKLPLVIFSAWRKISNITTHENIQLIFLPCQVKHCTFLFLVTSPFFCSVFLLLEAFGTNFWRLRLYWK